MKKLTLLATLVTATALTTAAFAMPGKNMKGEMSMEDFKTRMEQHVSQNPNLKMGEIEEKDGMFHAKIFTKDDSLVKEVSFDPKNPKGFMHGGDRKTPLTVEQVKAMLDTHLMMMENDNLKIGEVTEEANMIKATIVTKDGSLVKELSIDPASPRMGMHMLSGGIFGKGGMMKDGMMKDGMMKDCKDMMKGGMMKDGMMKHDKGMMKDGMMDHSKMNHDTSVMEGNQGNGQDNNEMKDMKH